jgi:hypothetical protein
MQMDFRTKLTQQNTILKSEISEVGEQEKWRPEEKQWDVNDSVEAESKCRLKATIRL